MPAPRGNQYAKGNKGGGRKTRYQKEYVRTAYQLALLGATDEEIGAAFGVSERTVNTWKLRHQDFASALQRGKVQADAEVAERLLERAMGYSHPEEKIFQYEGKIIRAETIKHYPPDTQAASLWLRNRQPGKWRDKQDLEHSGPGGGPLTIELVQFGADSDPSE